MLTSHLYLFEMVAPRSTAQGGPLLSLVVPVYNEEGNINPFLDRVGKVLQPLTEAYEIIFCYDISRDGTEAVILRARESDPRIKMLKFSRRFGQPMATMAGLQHASGEAVIVMDVDMQDPPELLETMFQKWREGYDVVLPQRRQRTGEPWIKKLVAETGYKVINRIAEVPIPPNTGDFRLMSRRVVDELVKLKESHGFLRGMVSLVGFKQCLVPFDRPPRHSGETNYNRFLGSLRIGFNGIYCFSSAPLALATVLGFGAVGLAFLFGLLFLFDVEWSSPLLAILTFLGGVQLICVGILGSYIGRIYEEVRQRPKFIVEEKVGFDPAHGE